MKKQPIESYYKEFIGGHCTNITRAKELCAKMKKINDDSCDILNKKERWPVWKKVIKFFDFKSLSKESYDLMKRSEELQNILKKIIQLHITVRH